MNRIQDMAAIVPYMTCVGNHGKLNQTNVAYCITLAISLDSCLSPVPFSAGSLYRVLPRLDSTY